MKCLQLRPIRQYNCFTVDCGQAFAPNESAQAELNHEGKRKLRFGCAGTPYRPAFRSCEQTALSFELDMIELVKSRQTDLMHICEQFRVSTLALFGSATRLDFQPETSDLDFVVEFFPMSPQEHAQSYFGLVSELEHLFGRAIDLIEISAVRNPYVRRNIEASQVPLYAAA